MSDLRDLYQQVIIEHSKHPRNFCVCEHATHIQEGYNPLCGDRIKLYVDAENNKIVDISFQGQGCAISMSAASLMTEIVKGKTIDEALEIFSRFQQLVTTPIGSEEEKVLNEVLTKLGKLAVFSGVREFPLRIKCATLPWHALKAALTHEKKAVTTE